MAIQTYIAKLKSTISDLETEILQLKDGDPHAHYNGHEKCTSDHEHGHSHHGDEDGEKCCEHGGEEGHSHEVRYYLFD